MGSRPAALTVVGLLCLLTLSGALKGQSLPEGRTQVWGVGALGGGQAGSTEGLGLFAEGLLGTEPGMFALRLAGVMSPVGNTGFDTGLLFVPGHVSGRTHLSVGLGVGWAWNEYCEDSSWTTQGQDQECETESAIGLPWEVGISYQAWQRFGLGIKVYGNRNSAKSFWGVGLSLRRLLYPA